MILDKINFIFIHIPKCGGNSLTKLFSNYSNEKIYIGHGRQDKNNRFEIGGKFTKKKHQKLDEYKKNLGDLFEKYKIITIIRDPVKRLLSQYYSPDSNLHPNYFIRKINHFTKKKFNFLLFSYIFYKYREPKLNLETFENFIKTQDSQSNFLKINQNFRHPDYIINFEKYDEDVNDFCKKIGIEYSYIYVNKKMSKINYDELDLKKLQRILEKTHHAEDYSNFSKYFKFK